MRTAIHTTTSKRPIRSGAKISAHSPIPGAATGRAFAGETIHWIVS